MRRLKRIASRKKNTTLKPVHSGPTAIHMIEVEGGDFHSHTAERIEEVEKHLQDTPVDWIHIDGVHDVNTIEKVGGILNLHPLVVEDILNVDHRPKLEVKENHLLVILKRLAFHPEKVEVLEEQISIVIFDKVIISFGEAGSSFYERVITQAEEQRQDHLLDQSDGLFHTMLDVIVDEYMKVTEEMGDDMEELEDRLIMHPRQNDLQTIYEYRHAVLSFKKRALPVQDMLIKLLQQEFDMIQVNMREYFNDIYDHMVVVADAYEAHRGQVASLVDLYYSSISNKMNEIMKVLTIVSTIFIPLTFIAGIYGMNFAHMPELDEQWAYPLVWVIMISLTVGMLIYFKVKKWY
ncbi:magnesium/cobalt transporter CorA [Mangrovibacillus cuniculi]|uniref:Magnesium transport protein CorA n=1 Tax=Mangrovibacillus cuniculi TaxID=2593652 RepID=A0A7S8HEV6_9BACI|nr:magnesium/cobalt transporter CorA [Mangrovibacillus cuniculi]QPC45770.1 magnesium/cobalt transporter CorA [Mangrovibacillus cuniculi]